MTTERSAGFILRRHPFSETSLITHWLTADHGRIATIARGALRPKSPFRGKLDVFFHAEILFRRRPGSDLHTLTELHLVGTHPNLRTDLARLETAAYAVRWLEQNTETETPVPGLHSLFANLLQALDRHGHSPRLVPGFELHALADLGLLPDPAATPLTPPARELMAALLAHPPSDLSQIDVPASPLTELDRFLLRFQTRHLGRIPRRRPAPAPS